MKKLAYFSIHELLQKKAILEVQDGNHGEQHPRQSDFVAEGIPFLTATQVLDDQIFLNKAPRISFEKAKKLRIGWIKPNDVLLSHNATVGRVSVVPLFEGQAVIGTSLTYYRLNPQFFNPHFFALVLKSQDFQNQLEQSMQQTTRNQVPITRQKELKIPLPALPEQKQIVAILEKCDRLRRTRRYSLQLSETFLQSVFLEMFGDPATNPMGWDIKTIEDVANKSNGAIKCGPFGSQLLISELQNDGIPVYGIDNVQKNQFLWAKPKFISHEKFKELKSFSINSGDVLISRTGTVGRACLAPDSIPKSIIGPNLLKVTLDQSKLLPIVLSCAINYCSSVLEEIILMSPGATVAVFNTGNLKSLKLPIPPLPLQEKFAQIVQKHERFRTQQREAERQAEHLFQTLLHRAFRGELTSSDSNEVDISALSAENHPQQPKPKSTDKAENLPIPATQPQTNALQLTLPGLE